MTLESQLTGTLVVYFLQELSLVHCLHQCQSVAVGCSIQAFLQQGLQQVDGIGELSQLTSSLSSSEVRLSTAERAETFALQQGIGSAGLALVVLRLTLVARAVEGDEVWRRLIDDCREVRAEVLQCHDILIRLVVVRQQGTADIQVHQVRTSIDNSLCSSQRLLPAPHI